MQNLIEHMAEIELSQFSVNDYRGLPDAPPFCVVEGELPVVVSAPHAVSQLREGRVKPSDDFTGAMALAVAELAGASAIVACRYDACDPNWDPFESSAYKQALAEMVRRRGAVAVLDLHGVPAAAPDAIEIGSADGRTVQAMPGADDLACRFLQDRLGEHLGRCGKAVGLNGRHAARGVNTVAHAIARECGVAALQVEISSPFRVPVDAKGHVPPGEAVPFTSDQLPVELVARRNPDPACVEAVVRALADLARILADWGRSADYERDHLARVRAGLDVRLEGMNATDADRLARVRAGLSECMVLLRKDGAFPLSGPCKLAAYGNGVRHSVKGGTGSGDVNAHVVVGIERGFADAGFVLTSGTWLDAYDERRLVAKADFRKQLRREAKAAGDFLIFYAMGAVMPEPDYDIPLDFSADAAVYVLSRTSGEGSDRKPSAGDLLLTATEIRDILALDERYERFMLVLNTGGPVDLSPVKDVGNILVLSQLGSEMGNALADVLLGKASPSGKLATTWSAWEDYCPDIEMGDLDDTPYREGVFVGYRYFDTVGKRALFPFGFGLSYAEFELGEATTSLDGSRATVSVDISNVGGFSGKEVVQVYVTAPERELAKPWQELVGFAKTGLLQPGATERVEVSFDFADLASYSEEACAYVLEAGEYVVRLGTCSADAQPVAVAMLPRGVLTRTVRPIVAPAEIDEVVYERAVREEQVGALPRLALDPESFPAIDVAYDGEPEVDPVVAALADEDLAYACVGNFSGAGGLLSVVGNASSLVAGAAGETTSRLRNAGFEPLVMADGPAGLRLSREFYRDKKGAHPVGEAPLPDGMLDVLGKPVQMLANALSGGKKLPRGAELRTQYCTALPIGTAIAQSWNLEYARTCGDVVGAEMERFGVHLWLAPALNIHRSVLCGRNFEYLSEDPLVSGKIAAALVNGAQAHGGCGATIKHFAANNQETNRYYSNSCVSERALREIYLRGFGICVRESRPVAVMTSYNLVNGTHASESRGLIEGYLRAECGFDGVVMTDWVVPVPNRGERWPGAQAGRVAAAGGDLFMPGGKGDFKDVLKALASGRLDRRQLEANATRALRMSRRLAQHAS